MNDLSLNKENGTTLGDSKVQMEENLQNTFFPLDLCDPGLQPIRSSTHDEELMQYTFIPNFNRARIIY